MPADLGLRDGRLAPCPSSPNCVSSDAADDGHRTDPFELALPATASVSAAGPDASDVAPDEDVALDVALDEDAAEAWVVVLEVVAGLPGTRIVEVRDDYLRAESTTPLLGFVDDLELQLLAAEGRIAVRSASRVGWSDMGANRDRVATLRRELEQRGVVR